MIGTFKIYDQDYASTSKTGWYETIKISPKEYAVLELFPDGSGSYRTFETSKSKASEVAKRMAVSNKTEKPYFIDHGVKYYSQEAF